MYKSQLLSSKCKTIKTINLLEDGVVGICKGPLTRAIFIAQGNTIFVAKKLQLQNGACKPAAISVRHRRCVRCNSRNTDVCVAVSLLRRRTAFVRNRRALACEQALIFVVINDVARAAKPRVTSRRAQRAGERSGTFEKTNSFCKK